MKYTLKLILWLHAKNNYGQHPIYVKITINRKTNYIATGHHILQKMWDEKNECVKNIHSLATDINAQLLHKKSLITRKITDLQLAEKTITAKELKDLFNSNKNLHNIFDFVDEFIKEVQHKRETGTLEVYRKHLLRLELFHGSKELSFEDITTQFLSNYEQHLRKDVGNNYISALFKTLKVFFNAAIKKGVITNYPFHQYESPIYKAPVKDYLTTEEIKLFETFADETKDLVLKQTAVYFLLGVCTGIRISDWFGFDIAKNVQDDKVLLRATKNGEWVSMPVNSILKRNLKRMQRLPLTIEEPTINRSLKEIAIKLGINKHLTSHSARHSFAVTLCADRGVSSETCAELMAITISTCVENYYRVSSRKIDAETLKAWKGL